jgi:hypothetical protein
MNGVLTLLLLILTTETATNTNFIINDPTSPGFDPTIDSTQGEPIYHYTTDAVEVPFENQWIYPCFFFVLE